jgi:hypothetical protein
MVSTVDGTVRDVPVVEGAVVIEVTGFSDGLTTEVTDGLSTEGRGGERGRGERGRGATSFDWAPIIKALVDRVGRLGWTGRRRGVAACDPRLGGPYVWRRLGHGPKCERFRSDRTRGPSLLGEARRLAVAAGLLRSLARAVALIAPGAVMRSTIRLRNPSVYSAMIPSPLAPLSLSSGGGNYPDPGGT